MFFNVFFLISIKYFLITDCGSTATRIYAYQWDETVPSSDIYIIDPPLSEPKSVPISLSTAIHDTNAISNIFTPLLSWAKKAIPSEFHKNTSFEFYGTSSMRQLTPSEQRTIIRNTREFLQKDGTFLIDKYAGHVLTTQEETVFLWIAMNTLVKNEISNDNPIATIEIASQNSNFAVNVKSTKGIKQYVTTISSPTISLDVFVPVFGGFGIDEVIMNHIVSKSAISGSSTISSPCFLKGYKNNLQHFVVTGEGDFDQCYSFISNTTLSDKSCSTDKCIFNSVPFVEFKKLYGLSTLDYTRSFFNLASESKISEYVSKGKEYCQREWTEVNSEYADDNPNKPYLGRYCLYSAYITNFLQRGLGVTDSTDLYVANKINGLPISYTLGAVLAVQQKLDNANNKLKWYEILLVVLIFAAFFGVIIAIIVCCCIMKKKKKERQNEVLLMRYQWDESDSSLERAKRENDDEKPALIEQPPEQQIAGNFTDLTNQIGDNQLEIQTNEQKMAEVTKQGFEQMGNPELKTPETADQQLQGAMCDMADKFANNQLTDLNDQNSLSSVLKDAQKKYQASLQLKPLHQPPDNSNNDL